jgi:hypothetical protein
MKQSYKGRGWLLSSWAPDHQWLYIVSKDMWVLLQ